MNCETCGVQVPDGAKFCSECGAVTRLQHTEARRERPRGGWLQRFHLSGVSEGEFRRGQLVLVTARWVLVLLGLILALNQPSDLIELRTSIVVILGLSVVNFFLHTNIVKRRPVSRNVIYAASVGDIAAISAIIGMDGGFSAYAFAFYYPAVLACALVFPLWASAYMTVGALGAYAAAVAVGSSAEVTADPERLLQVVLVRMLTLVAMAAVGNMFQAIERRRLAEESMPVGPLGQEAVERTLAT